MKFWHIIGNPPYQPSVNRGKDKGDGGSGSGNVIWDKFVTKSLDVLKTNGYLCLVHPAKWRKPLDKVGEEMMKHQFHYLEIHNDQDGLKTFGATTRYDWYIMQNCLVTTKTVIKDEIGNTIKLDIAKLPFVPNFDFDLSARILAKDGEEICKIHFISGAYRVYLPHMSKEKRENFIYPCVTATSTEGIRLCYSNTKDRGLFGIPKLIFSDARHIVNAVVDWEGEYGMTQNAMGIQIDSKTEGEEMKKALESEKFNTFLKACRWSNFQIDYRMFKFFRKDFWKEFV